MLAFVFMVDLTNTYFSKYIFTSNRIIASLIFEKVIKIENCFLFIAQVLIDLHTNM